LSLGDSWPEEAPRRRHGITRPSCLPVVRRSVAQSAHRCRGQSGSAKKSGSAESPFVHRGFARAGQKSRVVDTGCLRSDAGGSRIPGGHLQQRVDRGGADEPGDPTTPAGAGAAGRTQWLPGISTPYRCAGVSAGSSSPSHGQLRSPWKRHRVPIEFLAESTDGQCVQAVAVDHSQRGREDDLPTQRSATSADRHRVSRPFAG